MEITIPWPILKLILGALGSAIVLLVGWIADGFRRRVNDLESRTGELEKTQEALKSEVEFEEGSLTDKLNRIENKIGSDE